MASGEALKRLFQSYQRHDDEAFRRYAHEIISNEREKHHHLLAQDLEEILEQDYLGSRKHRQPPNSRRLSELPLNSDRDNPLLDVRIPDRSLDQIVLSSDTRTLINSILREHARVEVLRTYRILPRRKLLFCGPPGCGKSISAQAIALELDVPIFTIRVDAIVSSLLGDTAANLRKVFNFAEANPGVFLFDDFDALGRRRDDPSEHGELKRLVNSFLHLLDGFCSEHVIVATTNHWELLDRAIWRRFDEVLYFGLPTRDEIQQLLELRLSSVRVARSSLDGLASELEGMSFSDVERVCFDAIRGSLLNGNKPLSRESLRVAVDQQKRREAINNLARPDVDQSSGDKF